jgi:4'-phosphopantetheinyl transferase
VDRDDAWLPPPNPPSLPPAELHVWRATLDPGARTLEQLEATLDQDERARARRFIVEHGARRFTAARGFLRDVLARYTGRHPASLHFEYGERGKPVLAGGPHFNLSHSGEVALLAVTGVAPVGVDVEQVNRLPDFEHIAERFFARGERDALRQAAPDDYADAWYRCWTRKEAYIKATGDGLHFPLDRFEVTLLPGEPPAIRTLDGSARAASAWTVHHLEPGPGAVGAVALAAPTSLVRLFDWAPLGASPR